MPKYKIEYNDERKPDIYEADSLKEEVGTYCLKGVKGSSLIEDGGNICIPKINVKKWDPL